MAICIVMMMPRSVRGRAMAMAMVRDMAEGRALGALASVMTPTGVGMVTARAAVAMVTTIALAMETAMATDAPREKEEAMALVGKTITWWKGS